MTDSGGRSMFATNSLFRGVCPSVLEGILTQLSIIECSAGDIVMSEAGAERSASGQSTSEQSTSRAKNREANLFLIVSGTVHISRLGPDGSGGSEQIIAELGQDDFFGEMGLLSDGHGSACAVAATQCTLGKLDAEAFRKLLESDPHPVARNLFSAMTSRLRRTNDELVNERLTRDRLGVIGSVMSGVVHDLRNPLGVISGVAELLETGNDRLQTEQLAGMLKRATEHMNGIVEDILIFARGSEPRRHYATSVASVAQRVDELGLRPIENRGRVTVRRQVTDGPLVADSIALTRALLNLVKNAEDAMSNGGVLTFTAHTTQSTAEFVISDTGGGIPDEMKSRLFTPFATHGKPNGTGLGLAITKSCVDAHGGRIVVESSPGVGTTFRVVLPMSVA